MDGALVIRTLGEVTVTKAANSEVVQLTVKQRALVVYLAFSGRPCRREFMAELLWPNRSQGQSLTNLRKLLGELRQILGPWLEITREAVSLSPASSYWLDAREFEIHLAKAQESLRSDRLASEAASALTSAVALYRGDFLGGFSAGSEEYDAWAELERERLRFGMIEALDQLVEEHLRHGNVRAGMDCIARLTALDPRRERTYLQSMRLLVQAGDREAALRQYELCAQTLCDELGITPSAPIVELYEHIRGTEFRRSGQDTNPPARSLHTSRLPSQPTTFIGRHAEIQSLLDQLANRDCRLLTIGGAGGIGKTRLALEVAQRAAAVFALEVAFVPLADVRTAEGIAPAILSALAVPLTTQSSDLNGVLLEYLADKSMLLVLDNMEHLVADTSLVEAILDKTEHVQLLVTSRQPLALRAEWYVELTGMHVPETPDAQSPEAYSSVQLFVERARRVRNTFTLQEDPEGVIRICQLVEGLPLGIELAAAWVLVMTCSEIATRLLGLESPYRRSDERHRSLRSLFENVWQQLDTREQQLLMQLSVFHGGFTAVAADTVTGAQLPDLALLVRKSLLNVNLRTNRYAFHQLLLQFLRAQLSSQPELEAQALDAHSAYFLGQLLLQEASLQSSQPGRALDELRPDIENSRAAWQYALAQSRFDDIERCCTSLNRLFTLGLLHFEALDVFEQSLGRLAKEPESVDRDRVELALQLCLIAPLTAVYGWEDRHLLPVAQRVRTLAERLGNDQHVMSSLILLVDLYANEEWEKAVHVAEDALVFSQHMSCQTQMAAYVLTEVPLLFTGRHSRALQHGRKAQALFDDEDCAWATSVYGIDPLVISLSHSGMALTFLGYVEQGEQAVEAACKRAADLGQPLAVCFALAFDCINHLYTRETDKSAAASDHLTQLAQEHRFAHWQLFGPAFRAICRIQQGDTLHGIDALTKAIESQRRTHITHNVPSYFAHLGYAYARIQRWEQATSAFSQALTEIERTGETFHASLVHRLRGEMMVMRGSDKEANACFETAIQIAHQQEASFYELQAMLCLCEQGQVMKERLQTLTAQFTEGFDRPDLVEARRILTF